MEILLLCEPLNRMLPNRYPDDQFRGTAVFESQYRSTFCEVNRQKMIRMNRDDMLELTRRMNTARHCFSRIAGCYTDEHGEFEGSFNIHFLKLDPAEQGRLISVAKTIPFAPTTTALRLLPFPGASPDSRQLAQLFHALLDCELKNDMLLDTFYDYALERLALKGRYGIYIFFGTYDIPRMGKDRTEQWESELVYRFLIGAICPVHGDYIPDSPCAGFLYPGFLNRMSAPDTMAVYAADNYHADRTGKLLGI